MSDLFKLCDISRQAHHQRLIREKHWASLEYLVVGLIMQIREIHPGMGLRVIYDILKPNGLGRDAFISIGLSYGFRLITYKNQIRTTFSSPFSRYKNLLVDKQLNNMNQLWTSDITYYNIADKFYYIVMIIDVYSRKIIGYSTADNMRAENNCHALEMAFHTRKKKKYTELIHHSDRGGQYISDDYVSLLKNANIAISMCNEVHENSHIERVNGTIKNQYLRYWESTSLEELKTNVKKAIDTYNNKRPHSSLGKRTPDSFEQYIKELEVNKRPKLNIWTSDGTKKTDPNQTILQF
jgi:transposase InsO family protein